MQNFLLFYKPSEDNSYENKTKTVYGKKTCCMYSVASMMNPIHNWTEYSNNSMQLQLSSYKLTYISTHTKK